MTTTAHPLRVLVDHGDGRTPTYQLEVDAQAAIVGCAPAAGRGPDGPAVAVMVAEPAQPSGTTKTVSFVVAGTFDPAALPGWTPAGLGTVEGRTVVQVEPDPDWHAPTR